MRRMVSGLLMVLFGIVEVRAVDPPTERAALVKGNTQFALDLYQQLRSQKGNLFLSPLSISSALSMTFAGARGATADEMARTLHFDLEPSRLHPAFGTLLKETNGTGKRGYQLSMANALWGQKGYPFQPDFLRLTKEAYGSTVRNVDFAGATEVARRTINAWVERETASRIKDLLKEGTLPSDTRLVLTNAIYFKGEWASQFKKDRTREAPFYLSASNRLDVPMMSQTAAFRYLEGDTFQVLELPYAGNELAMLVLLPKKIDGLAALETELTLDKLAGWIGRLRKDDVEVHLPRFKLTAEFQLSKTLTAMGMKTAFAETADFSGIASKERLKVDAVIHKAFVDVNEEGTEAAASTAITIKPLSFDVNMPVFRADRPFVFLIRDLRSGAILFLGRVVEPR